MNAIKLNLGDFIYRLIEIPFETEGKFVTSKVRGYDYERVEIEKLSRDKSRGIILVNDKFPFPEISTANTNRNQSTNLPEWYITEEEIKSLVTDYNKVTAEMLEAEINKLMTVADSLSKLSQPKNYK